MKLTKSTLQKIIKEEINNVLNERELPGGMDLDPGSAPRAPAGQQKQQQPSGYPPADRLLNYLSRLENNLDTAMKEIYTRLNDLDGKGVSIK